MRLRCKTSGRGSKFVISSNISVPAEINEGVMMVVEQETLCSRLEAWIDLIEMVTSLSD